MHMPSEQKTVYQSSEYRLSLPIIEVLEET